MNEPRSSPWFRIKWFVPILLLAIWARLHGGSTEDLWRSWRTGESLDSS